MRQVLITTTITLLSCLPMFGQTTYKCTHILGEWAQWEPRNVLIAVTEHEIIVHEVTFAKLIIEYTSAKKTPDGIQWYYYLDVPVMAVNVDVITVLEKHYKCPDNRPYKD